MSLPDATRVAHRFLSRSYDLSPEEDRDLALAQWQRDIGNGAVKALKSLRGVSSVKGWSVDSRYDIVIRFTWPRTGPAQPDKYYLDEIQELGEMAVIAHLKTRLRGLLGVGRAHSEWGGFWTDKDSMYVGFDSKNLDNWVLRITPHSAR